MTKRSPMKNMAGECKIWIVFLAMTVPDNTYIPSVNLCQSSSISGKDWHASIKILLNSAKLTTSNNFINN